MVNQSGQSLDSVIDGLMAMAQSVYGATWDPNLGVWAAARDGLQLAVCEGSPGAYQPDLLVIVGSEITQPVARPTMGTTRSRERTAAISIGFSVFSATSTSAARRACSSLVADYEDHFRTSGAETLTGSCREAWVSNIAGPNPRLSVNTEGQILGYLSEAVVTVTAAIRY